MLTQAIQWIVTAPEPIVIIWLGLLLLLVVLYTSQQIDKRPTNEPPHGKRTPLEELQLRYIQGEITEEQYQHRRQELVHGG